MKKKELKRLLREAQAKKPGRVRVRKVAPLLPEVEFVKPVRKPMKVSATALARAATFGAKPKLSPFNLADLPQPPPGTFGTKADAKMAMDEQQQIINVLPWAGSYFNGAFAEGLTFLGYAYLAELTQRPEYRVISETIATEMTRKWIKIKAQTGTDPDSDAAKKKKANPFTKLAEVVDAIVPGAEENVAEEDKTKKIKELEDELERLKVREHFCTIALQDGFFGRAHLYLDFGTSDDRNELKTPIGNGRNAITKNKVKRGKLERLATVEAIWCYPTNYNSNDPLKSDWYNPSSWFVQGKEVHSSRLLKFVGREVPDLLKPAYSFGGLSLSQMAKPYIDNWLRTRQSVADIIHSFSVFVLKTNMGEDLQVDGEQLFMRLGFFNRVRDNTGVMALDKDSEDFSNISAPLGSLDALQAQTQEHMAAVCRIPLVKLLGIQPAGLNASSEGEIQTFDDTINAYQRSLFGENLARVIDFAQINIWGKVDPEITWEFEPLRSLEPKEISEVQKIKAETDAILIEAGEVSPAEARKRLAADEDSEYSDINPDDEPDLAEEEAAGLPAKPPKTGGGEGAGIGSNETAEPD